MCVQKIPTVMLSRRACACKFNGRRRQTGSRHLKHKILVQVVHSTCVHSPRAIVSSLWPCQNFGNPKEEGGGGEGHRDRVEIGGRV